MTKKIYVPFKVIKVIFLAKIGNFGVVVRQPHQLFQIFRDKFFFSFIRYLKKLATKLSLGILDLFHYFLYILVSKS